MDSNLDQSKPQSGATLAPAALLDARVKCIEKVAKEVGDEKDENGETSAIRGVLIMLAREAAGQGFDAGVKFMASNSVVYQNPRPKDKLKP